MKKYWQQESGKASLGVRADAMDVLSLLCGMLKKKQIPMYLREGPYYFVLWNALALLRHFRAVALG